ncbi:hypothetical protein BC936DRAFT_140286, partial [Jimgerdemannia flammicorona]
MGVISFTKNMAPNIRYSLVVPPPSHFFLMMWWNQPSSTTHRSTRRQLLHPLPVAHLRMIQNLLIKNPSQVSQKIKEPHGASY